MEEETINPEVEVEQPKEEKKSRRGFAREFLDGSLLTKSMVINQLPFILFLTLIGFLYIANGYHAEKLFRDNVKLNRELKDLRAESMSIASELMYLSNQTRVIQSLKEIKSDLIESNKPPKKIVIRTKKSE